MENARSTILTKTALRSHHRNYFRRSNQTESNTVPPPVVSRSGKTKRAAGQNREVRKYKPAKVSAAMKRGYDKLATEYQVSGIAAACQTSNLQLRTDRRAKSNAAITAA